MDNREVTDFESSITTDSKAVTTFFESDVINVGISSRSTHELSTYIEGFDDIKSFLLRPYLIANGQWTNSMSANSNLNSGTIASLLSSVSIWANKIQGFNLIRGDFMIKVQINATPFHQGKLILHYLPNESNFVAVNPHHTKSKNVSLVQKVQHPHVEIDCRKTSAIMRIPYVAPTPWYAIKEGYYDWGTWYLDVFSALATGALGEGYVDYAVYAWWENIELNAPTLPQSDSTEVRKKVKRRGGEVSESQENQGPITMGLRKASKVANILSEIPVLSNFTKPVEWVTNILSNATSVLGWSKPRELTGQTIVVQQQLRYAGTCDGPDIAYPGGVSCLNRLETIDYGSFTTEDEMSLNYLYKIPYFCGEFTWSASAGQGTSLLSQKLSPLSFLQTGIDSVAGHTATYEFHVPFTYLARMHKLWRGGLVLTLKFIKTQMHSGRIQVTWIPCNTPDITPGLNNSSFNKRAIIDVRTEDTVSLEMPYLLFSDYASTVPISPNLTYSGQFDIQVLNDLRAPETCSQNIQVQWFISAADDFELSVPSMLNTGGMQYIPQSDGAEILRDSVHQGMELPTTEIGGKSTYVDLLFHSKRCVGEKIMSIKSYLLRNSVIQGTVGTTFDFSTDTHLVIDPYFIAATQLNSTTGAPNYCNWGGDAFSMFAPWYAYFRGSMKISLVQLAGGQKLATNVMPITGAFATQPYSSSFIANANVFFAANSPTTGSATYPLNSCNIQDETGFILQHAPYYNRLPFGLTSYYNGIDTPTADPGRPVTTIYAAGEFTANPVFQRSVGDDFQLMFFTGCPPLCISYA